MLARRPFKSIIKESTKEGHLSLVKATEQASEGYAVLFYQNGYYGLVWLENGIRKVRDLKGWDEFKNQWNNPAGHIIKPVVQHGLHIAKH